MRLFFDLFLIGRETSLSPAVIHVTVNVAEVSKDSFLSLDPGQSSQELQTNYIIKMCYTKREGGRERDQTQITSVTWTLKQIYETHATKRLNMFGQSFSRLHNPDKQ